VHPKVPYFPTKREFKELSKVIIPILNKIETFLLYKCTVQYTEVQKSWPENLK
jgi:hypothetical protein